jgi:hypothetical protein
LLRASQAALEAERLNAACDTLAEAAIQRHREDSAAAAAAAAGGKQEQQVEADAAGQGDAERAADLMERESTQQLVERAQAAEQVRAGCGWYCCKWLLR